MTNGKIEIKNDSIDEVKTNVLNYLRDVGALKDFGEIKIVKIKKGIYSVEGYTGNISYFSDETGNVLFSTVGPSKQYFFGKAQQLSGYIEKKDSDGKFHMYKISKYNPESDSFELGEEIDKYSIEYYNAWKDIIFYLNFLGTEALRVNGEGGYTTLDKEWIDTGLLLSNDLRIFQIIDFLKHGQIDQELFDYALKRINTTEYIISQILDERLRRIKKQITQQELEDYNNKGYIDGDTFTKCLNALEEFQEEKDKRKACENDTRECTKKILKGFELGK